MVSDVLISALRLFSVAFFWALIIRIVIDWVLPRSRGRRDFLGTLYRIAHGATEPILQPIRRLIPDLGGLDISPIIAIFLVDWIVKILISLLARAGW
jgi:YggT family protein